MLKAIEYHLISSLLPILSSHLQGEPVRVVEFHLLFFESVKICIKIFSEINKFLVCKALNISEELMW